MGKKTSKATERDSIRTAEFLRRFEKWRMSQSDYGWKIRGWKAKAAKATGIDPTVVSRIFSGRRPVTVDHMAEFVQALNAPELLPPDVPRGALPSVRQDSRSHPRSDPPDTVPDLRRVPRGLAEYLVGKGEEDEVRVWELIDVLGMQNLEESGAKQSPDFYRGMLLAVRGAGPGSRTR